LLRSRPRLLFWHGGESPSSSHPQCAYGWMVCCRLRPPSQPPTHRLHRGTLPNEYLPREQFSLIGVRASYFCMSWITSSSVPSHMRRLGRQLYRNTRSGEACKQPSCLICFPLFGKGCGQQQAERERQFCLGTQVWALAGSRPFKGPAMRTQRCTDNHYPETRQAQIARHS